VLNQLMVLTYYIFKVLALLHMKVGTMYEILFWATQPSGMTNILDITLQFLDLLRVVQHQKLPGVELQNGHGVIASF